jgi:hypothetical protein
VDLNLDTLKREILEYLEAGDFAIFRNSPGGLEGLPMVLWDTEHYPDYRMFLEAARVAGVRLVMFASREFEAADLDELEEQLDDCGLSRDERRDCEARLHDLKGFEGQICSIELAFSLDSRIYVYEVQPDWYEDFLTIEDEITTRVGEGEDLGEDDSLGGYFSKN